MGNIVPRVGIEPISLTFQASVLPFHHVDSLMSPLYPRLPVSAAPCLRGQYRLLNSSPWNHLLMLTYIHTGNGDTQGRFNNHTACSLSSILVMATSVVGVMKMGNIVPIAGLEPTSPGFRATVLPFHHVGFPDVTTKSTPTCLCSSVPQMSVQTTTVL